MTKPRGASSLSRRDDNKRIGTAEAALTGGLFSFKPFATKIDHSGYFRCSPKSGSTADIGGGPVRAINGLLRSNKPASFNHVIGATEHCSWDNETKRFRSRIVLTPLKWVLPGQQTSSARAAMQAPDPDPFDDCDAIVCYGGAKATDNYLASTVHCVDDEIYRMAEAP
jgi:hypothetical protein